MGDLSGINGFKLEKRFSWLQISKTLNSYIRRSIVCTAKILFSSIGSNKISPWSPFSPLEFSFFSTFEITQAKLMFWKSFRLRLDVRSLGRNFLRTSAIGSRSPCNLVICISSKFYNVPFNGVFFEMKSNGSTDLPAIEKHEENI